MDSSHGSEVSEVECSQAGEHCDNADIPCVEHDDDNFFDMRQHPLDGVLPLSSVVRDPQSMEPAAQPQQPTTPNRNT